jgi:hypothetical protein
MSVFHFSSEEDSTGHMASLSYTFTIFVNHSQKCVISDTHPSPTPAKRRATYGDIKENFVCFNEHLQRTCKVTLYDLSVGDQRSVTNTLHSLLRQGKSFMDETLPLLNKEDLKCKAMQQKNSTLSAYNLNLDWENNDLRRKLQQYTEFESAMSEAVDNTRYSEEKKEEKKQMTDDVQGTYAMCEAFDNTGSCEEKKEEKMQYTLLFKAPKNKIQLMICDCNC